MAKWGIRRLATLSLAIILLGAVAALGGFYFIERQACVQEAELVQKHWKRLSDEGLSRRIAVARQFATATSVDALLTHHEPAIGNSRSPYEDLRDLTLPEIEEEYASVSEYVNTQGLYEAANRIAPVETTAGGPEPGNIMGMTDEQLVAMRPAMNQAIDYMSAVLRVKNESDVVTDCSSSNVFSRISGEQPILVKVQVRAGRP
jgi:hypothetical protein